MSPFFFKESDMTDEIRLKQAHQTVASLIEKGWTVSFAESCTGGLACARLVDVPDASKVLNASFVTYANEAKISLLGVSEETLVAHGAVSEEVAYAMAQGIAAANNAQVGVGITGIAGPGGGTDEKPVGTVCFGFSIDGTISTVTKHFGALGRNNVRTAAVDFVFETLCKKLK